MDDPVRFGADTSKQSSSEHGVFDETGHYRTRLFADRSAAATSAFAELSIGVADDGGKLAEDGGAWFVSQMREASRRRTGSRSPGIRITQG